MDTDSEQYVREQRYLSEQVELLKLEENRCDTAVYLLLPTYLLITTHYLPLTTYRLPLTAYHLPLTTYHLPLTTYHLPLTTDCNRRRMDDMKKYLDVQKREKLAKDAQACITPG